MSRDIVKNGCSGECCKCFTLPVTMNDLHKMQYAYENNKIKVVCDNGIERGLVPKEELDYIVDMLIPLGKTEIDPQSEINLNDQYKDLKNQDGSWSKDGLRLKLNNHFLITAEGRMVANIYTCKHFDAENSVCLAYEKRPHFCQSFGSHCSYKNCSFLFNAIVEKEIKEESQFLQFMAWRNKNKGCNYNDFLLRDYPQERKFSRSAKSSLKQMK